MYRGQYDPQFIEHSWGCKRKYDPQVAAEQMAALQRRDPEWLAMHRGLGDKIRRRWSAGISTHGRKRRMRVCGKAGKGEPQQDSGVSGTGETGNRGYLAWWDSEYRKLRQTTQAILSRQPNLSYGEAQDMAAAVYTGQRGKRLKAAAATSHGTVPTDCNAHGAAGSESWHSFTEQAPPEGQALAQAGSYLSSPTDYSANDGGDTGCAGTTFLRLREPERRVSGTAICIAELPERAGV